MQGEHVGVATIQLPTKVAGQAVWASVDVESEVEVREGDAMSVVAAREPWAA